MSHGDFCTGTKAEIRDAILDAVDKGVPIRRALSIALEHLNGHTQELASIQSALLEYQQRDLGRNYVTRKYGQEIPAS